MQVVRRSGRISIQVPILIIGSDCGGRVFSEQTHTVVVSLYGAGIVSREKLLPEQELTLRSLETNRETEIRVVGEIASHEGVHTYGVAFLDEKLDFWSIAFPSPALPTVAALRLSLACSGCGLAFVVENGDFEFDVCAIHGGLVRFCSCCGYATVWKTTSIPPPLERLPKPVRKPESQSAYSGVSLLVETEPAKLGIMDGSVQPLAEIPRVEQSNRRARVRAKVSYFACVRSERFGDDIAPCIDMSRGGVAFKTENKYLVGTEVRIAVPYVRAAAEAPAIFVDARIANIRELFEEKLWRVGVEFLPRRQSGVWGTWK